MAHAPHVRWAFLLVPFCLVMRGKFVACACVFSKQRGARSKPYSRAESALSGRGTHSQIATQHTQGTAGHARSRHDAAPDRNCARRLAAAGVSVEAAAC